MAGTSQCSSSGGLRVRFLNGLIIFGYTHVLYRHPTEPQCSYDPVEGLTLAPDTDPLEKIKQLEDQICEYISLS